MGWRGGRGYELGTSWLKWETIGSKSVFFFFLSLENKFVRDITIKPPFPVTQVNGVSVVKVGHRQVVSLIRQGGSRLLMKVVSVTRKPDTGDVVRKKGVHPNITKHHTWDHKTIRIPLRCVKLCLFMLLVLFDGTSAPPPPKRDPSTSLTLRSKSMTAELEEMGKTHTHTQAGLRNESWTFHHNH